MYQSAPSAQRELFHLISTVVSYWPVLIPSGLVWKLEWPNLLIITLFFRGRRLVVPLFTFLASGEHY